MSLTLDDSSFSSNPGRVRVEPVVWARTHPLTTARPVAALGLCLAGAVWLHPMFALAAVACAVGVARFWVRLSEHMADGNVNPGVVLSPGRVAVLADLSRGATDIWAVKVLDQPVARANGASARVGARVATVALYSEDPRIRERWSDVHPALVDDVTRDPATLARVLASIPEGEWARLEAALAEVPHEPGLWLLKR